MIAEQVPARSLATAKDVAAFLGVTENRLAKMRMDGTGPEFIRMGARLIRYDWQTVNNWIAEKTRTSTDEYAA